MTRNLLITLVKDFPFWTLVKYSPKMTFHQLKMANTFRRHEQLGGYLKGWGAFLKALPSALGRRRKVIKQRKISRREFEELLAKGYPFPTKFVKNSPQRY